MRLVREPLPSPFFLVDLESFRVAEPRRWMKPYPVRYEVPLIRMRGLKRGRDRHVVYSKAIVAVGDGDGDGDGDDDLLQIY